MSTQVLHWPFQKKHLCWPNACRSKSKRRFRHGSKMFRNKEENWHGWHPASSNMLCLMASFNFSTQMCIRFSPLWGKINIWLPPYHIPSEKIYRKSRLSKTTRAKCGSGGGIPLEWWNGTRMKNGTFFMPRRAPNSSSLDRPRACPQPSRLQQVYNGRTGVEKEVSSVTGNMKMVLKSGLRRYSVHPDSHCKTGGMSWTHRNDAVKRSWFRPGCSDPLLESKHNSDTQRFSTLELPLNSPAQVEQPKTEASWQRQWKAKQKWMSKWSLAMLAMARSNGSFNLQLAPSKIASAWGDSYEAALDLGFDTTSKSFSPGSHPLPL